MNEKETMMHPIPLTWDRETVSRFWALFANSPLTYLSYSHLLSIELVRFIEKHVSQNDSILDFGAGNGDLAAALIDAGFSVGVYEPSEERTFSIQQMAQSASCNFLGVFTEAQSREFGHVLLFEVLEHILDEDVPSAMASICRFAGEQGVVLGSVPWNENLTDNYCICPACAAMFHRWQHVRSFDSEPLTEFLQEHDLPYVHTEISRRLGRLFFRASKTPFANATDFLLPEELSDLPVI